MKTGINPSVAIYVNIAYLTLTGISAGGAEVLWPGHGTQVLAWASLLAVPLNAVLHATSSAQAGPAVNQ